METLYSKIEINKVLEDYKEIRKYYITKDEVYGFKVTKSENNGLIEQEVLSMKNVIGSEEKIKTLIDEIIKCEEDYDQAKYIVEDYMKIQFKM